jgi:hypothetical protein
MPQARALPIRCRSAQVAVYAFPLALAFGGGCSPRSLPPSFPAGTAAGLETPEAPPRKVTRALDSDPPLPGEPTDGWPGLQPAATPEASAKEATSCLAGLPPGRAMESTARGAAVAHAASCPVHATPEGHER